MKQTKKLGLNITDMTKDGNEFFNFDTDLGYNFNVIDEKTLSHNNITNCVTEIPQDIKFSLENGVLTIKAGSIICIPYGNEDFSSIYTVGSTFLNDNYKVVATHYYNGKFFVQAKLQNDVKHTLQGVSSERAFVYIYPSTNWVTDFGIGASVSDSTISTGFVYSSETNTIVYYVNELRSHSGFSLPILLISKSSGVPSYVINVFNGISYIGNTVFILPGIKGLISDGRKSDGNLNNENVTISNIRMVTVGSNKTIILSSDSSGNLLINNDFIVSEIRPSGNYILWYKPSLNKIYRFSTDDEYSELKHFVIGEITTGTGKIDSLNIKLPFRAVDYFEFITKTTKLEETIKTLQEAVKALQG